MCPRKTFLIVLLAAFMMGAGLFSSDIYVAIQPLVSHSIMLSLASMHYTFSAFFLGLASAYWLLYLFGNKFSVVALGRYGFLAYIIGSLFCGFAHNVTIFILGRIIQAVGAAATSISVRSLLSELFNKCELVNIYAVCFPILGFSPAIMPFFGMVVAHSLDWRAIFWLLALSSVVVYFIFVHYLRAVRLNRPQSSTHASLKNVVTSFKFWKFSSVYALVFSVYYIYITTAPLIFRRLGAPLHLLVISLFALSIFYFIGNIFVKNAVKRCSVESLIQQGCIWFFVICTIMLVITHVWPSELVISLIVPICLLCFTNAFILPTISAKLLAEFKGSSLKMVCLQGVLQFLYVGMAMLISGHFIGDSITHFSVIIEIYSILILLIFCIKNDKNT